ETRNTKALPLLPLSSGAVFPQMVVTLALETDEAKRAGAAARTGGGQVLLIPRIDGRYGRIGTVAQVEDTGQLPSGSPGLVVRGLYRARIVGAGATGDAGALHVDVERIDDPEPSARVRELAREYRAIVETILEHRGMRRLAGLFQNDDDPGALADTVAYWPD